MKFIWLIRKTRKTSVINFGFILILMTSCVSYEPAQLVPEITLSAEEVSFFESVDSNLLVDFGMEVSDEYILEK